MATDLADLAELRCPYCGKLLNSDEYKHAVEEFKNRAAEQYKEQRRIDKQHLEDELRKLEHQHEGERRQWENQKRIIYEQAAEKARISVHNEIAEREIRIEQLRKDVEESRKQLTQTQSELKAFYDKQVQDLKKSYEDLNRQRQEEFRESLAQTIAKKDAKLQEKDKQLQEFENGFVEFKRQAVEVASKSARNEIEARDIQIKRLQ